MQVTIGPQRYRLGQEPLRCWDFFPSSQARRLEMLQASGGRRCLLGATASLSACDAGYEQSGADRTMLQIAPTNSSRFPTFVGLVCAQEASPHHRQPPVFLLPVTPNTAHPWLEQQRPVTWQEVGHRGTTLYTPHLWNCSNY